MLDHVCTVIIHNDNHKWEYKTVLFWDDDTWTKSTDYIKGSIRPTLNSKSRVQTVDFEGFLFQTYQNSSRRTWTSTTSGFFINKNYSYSLKIGYTTHSYTLNIVTKGENTDLLGEREWYTQYLLNINFLKFLKTFQLKQNFVSLLIK